MTALTDKQLLGIYSATRKQGDGWFVEGLRAVADAAVQAERKGQEPVAWMSPGKERLEFSRHDTVYGSHTIPLYTTPPAAPVPEDVAKDAERYRWLRAHWTTMRSSSTGTTLKLTTGEEPWAEFGPDVIDAAIDSAMLAASKQEPQS